MGRRILIGNTKPNVVCIATTIKMRMQTKAWGVSPCAIGEIVDYHLGLLASNTKLRRVPSALVADKFKMPKTTARLFVKQANTYLASFNPCLETINKRSTAC